MVVNVPGYDKKLWKDDKIMAYHVITLLCRNLRFDSIMFQPLNPLIFDANPQMELYARHHRDNRKKYSVYLPDLLLTDNNINRYNNCLQMNIGCCLEISYRDFL